MDKFKTGVIGADTRIGQELVRRLLTHPFVELAAVSSSENPGKYLATVCPSFFGQTDLTLVGEEEVIAKADVVFNADPYINSQELGAVCIKNKCVFIDLGDAFRFADAESYSLFKGEDFAFPGLHDAAIYGLPELMRDQMTGKVLVACPGAAATGAVLGLVPPVLEGLISHEGITVTAAVSAADLGDGRTAFGSAADDIGSVCGAPPVARYEIEQMLSIASGHSVRITFAENRVCASRGVLVTCFAKTALSANAKTITSTLEKIYAEEKFIRILPPDTPLSTRAVLGTNLCDLSVSCSERTSTAIITAALDPLGKGSAGQAIQNMNALLSLPEQFSVAGC